MNPALPSLPPGLLALLVVLAVAALALEIVALIDLYRRSRTGMVSGNKWLWLALILLLNLVGPILYLSLGRKHPLPPGSEHVPAPNAGEVADRLYGPKSDGQAQ